MTRLVVAVMIILFMWAAMEAGRRWERDHPIDPNQSIMINADYQRCVTVKTGPLLKPKGVPLYPWRKDVT